MLPHLIVGADQILLQGLLNMKYVDNITFLKSKADFWNTSWWQTRDCFESALYSVAKDSKPHGCPKLRGSKWNGWKIQGHLKKLMPGERAGYSSTKQEYCPPVDGHKYMQRFPPDTNKNGFPYTCFQVITVTRPHTLLTTDGLAHCQMLACYYSYWWEYYEGALYFKRLCP